jgi:hypothetical protein
MPNLLTGLWVTETQDIKIFHDNFGPFREMSQFNTRITRGRIFILWAYWKEPPQLMEQLVHHCWKILLSITLLSGYSYSQIWVTEADRVLCTQSCCSWRLPSHSDICTTVCNMSTHGKLMWLHIYIVCCCNKTYNILMLKFKFGFTLLNYKLCPLHNQETNQLLAYAVVAFYSEPFYSS